MNNSSPVQSPATNKMSRRHRALLASVLAVPAVAAFAQSAAFGQTLYWDANGTAAGSGVTPAGTWGVDPFWNDQVDGGGSGTIGAWVDGATAVFSAGSDAAGPYTVTVAGTQNAAGITLATGNLTLDQGQVNLTAAAVDVATGLTATVQSVVGGSVGLTKTNAGTLVLSAANTYDGVTAVNAGVLTVRNNASLGTTTAGTTVASGASINIDGAGLNVAENVTSLAGTGVTATGAIRNLANDNTWSGNLTLAAAASVLADAGNLTLAGNIDGTGLLTVGGAGNVVINGVIATGANGLTKTGTGTATLGAANTNTGTYTVTAGSLKLGAAGRIADAAPVSVSTGASLDLNGFAETVGSIAGAGTIIGTGNLTAGGNGTSTAFSGIIANTGTLTKNGTGTLTLSGVNTYSGTTTVNAGVLAISGTSPLGTTAAGTIVASGAAIQVSGAGSIGTGEFLTINGTGVANAGALRKTGTQTTTYAGGVGFATTGARINADAGTLVLAGGQSGSGGTKDLLYGGAGNISISGTLSATVGKVNYDGTGNLTLAASNLFTGGVVITGGNVNQGGEGASAAGTATNTGVIPSAVVPDYIQLSNAATLTSTRVGAGVTFLATNKGITLGAGGGTLAVTDVTAGNLNVYSGVITGTGPFIFKGPGILGITAVQTYTGPTNITGGTLRLRTNANLIPDNSAVTISAGAKFDIANFNETIGSLAGAGSVNSSASAGTLTAGGDGTSTTFSGDMSLSGGNSFTKVGTGTMTIAGFDWTTTGGININEGAIQYGNSAAGFGNSSTVTIAAAGTLDMNGFPDGFGALTGSGTVINMGALGVGVKNSSTTFSGTLNGTGSLTKNGTGTMTLTGVNTYAGTTTVTGGTLVAAAANNLGNESATNTLILNGGTLQTAAAITTTRKLAVNATNGTIDTNSVNSTISGAFTGAGTLNKISAGTLTTGTLSLGGLAVTGGQVTLPAGVGAAKLGTLAVTAAKFDLTNNPLALTVTNSATLRGLLLTGRAADVNDVGTWTGDGVISSTAAADPDKLTAIGYLTAGDKGVTTWNGLTGLAPSAVITLVTKYGDVNLDATVDNDDLALLDRGYAQYTAGTILPTAAVWLNGDFNYDGAVDSKDYLLADTSYGKATGQLSTGFLASREARFGDAYVSALVAAVPEPTSIGLAFAGAAAFLGRRRRNAR